jgi:hypothetical protein
MRRLLSPNDPEHQPPPQGINRPPTKTTTACRLQLQRQNRTTRPNAREIEAILDADLAAWNDAITRIAELDGVTVAAAHVAAEFLAWHWRSYERWTAAGFATPDYRARVLAIPVALVRLLEEMPAGERADALLGGLEMTGRRPPSGWLEQAVREHQADRAGG